MFDQVPPVPTISTFAPSVNYSIGVTPSNIQVADFNNDGHPELVVPDQGGVGGSTLLLGNGDGTFEPGRSVAPGVGAASEAVGDF